MSKDWKLIEEKYSLRGVLLGWADGKEGSHLVTLRTSIKPKCHHAKDGCCCSRPHILMQNGMAKRTFSHSAFFLSESSENLGRLLTSQ